MSIFLLGFSICLNVVLIIYIYFTRIRKEEFKEEEIVNRKEYEDFFEDKKSNNGFF